MALRDAVETALAASAIADIDRAASDLALSYSAAIDGRHQPCEECGCQGGGDLAKLGPNLLAALEALGLTPRARKAVKTDDKPGANPLDQLAAARARKGHAADLDAAAP